MTHLEIIKSMAHGFVDIETLQVAEFESSNLIELTSYFGRGFEWQGRFKKGAYLVQFLPASENPFNEDFDVYGSAFLPGLSNVALFYLGE